MPFYLKFKCKVTTDTTETQRTQRRYIYWTEFHLAKFRCDRCDSVVSVVTLHGLMKSHLVNEDEDSKSRKSVHPSCFCKILAGNKLLTLCSTQFFTANAFRLSGTEQIIL